MHIYRVSQKKRNGGFSVHCELKMMYTFIPFDRASFAEKNDTSIIKFGWVILILCQFLERRSFSNFTRIWHVASLYLCHESPFIVMLRENPIGARFFCLHRSMGFFTTTQRKAILDIILRSVAHKSQWNWKMTALQEMGIKSKVLNQI